MMQHRGEHRERSLGRDIYFSESYFAIDQLASLIHQIHAVWEFRPRSVIEIGIGNGFVSSFLRRAGFSVTTVDINASLEPDYCLPLSQAAAVIQEKADLVLCCEVLEHMPLEQLDANLGYLRALGERLFLTLPNSRYSVGVGMLLKAPIFGARAVGMYVDLPRRHKLEDGPHFWEVGSCPESSHKSLMQRLKKRYSSVKSSRFALNPAHVAFSCG